MDGPGVNLSRCGLVGVMLHPEIRALADAQLDLVAVWQLRALGWTEKQVLCRTTGLPRVHDGVLRVGRAQDGRDQRWKAATLTTPDTVLGLASAGDLHGVRPWPKDGGLHATVLRPGEGGLRTMDGLMVARSTLLGPGDVTQLRGIRVTRIERTLIDLAALVGPWELRRAMREALRLKRTTILDLEVALLRYARRAGTPAVRGLVERYGRLQLDRCRSDPEAYAMELLLDAGLPLPIVNVEIGGYEADLVFPDLRLIIEIDGPSFHVLKDADALRTRAWTAAGYTVRRVPSDDVYARPDLIPSVVRSALGR